MKKLILAAIVFGIVSCNQQQEQQTTSNQIEDNSYQIFEYGEVDVYHIQEIDGCEYILVNGYRNHEPALTHKGNCKYCLQRSQQSTLQTYEGFNEGDVDGEEEDDENKDNNNK